MAIPRKILCIAYGLIGAATLVPTWSNFVPLIQREGFWGANVNFWNYVLANEATRFITADALFVSLAITLWLVVEARRLHIKGAWFYVVASIFVGIGVAVPVFLIQRERRLEALSPSSDPGRLNRVDVGLLGALAVGVVAYAYTALIP